MTEDDIFPGSWERTVIPVHVTGNYTLIEYITNSHFWWLGESVTEKEYEKLVREWRLKQTIKNLLK